MLLDFTIISFDYGRFDNSFLIFLVLATVKKNTKIINRSAGQDHC